MSAQEFVERANESGAGLELAEQLSSGSATVEVWAVELAEEETAHPEDSDAAPEDDHGHGHGAGSLAVSESTEVAQAELARCENAVTLVCFRAGNVVLRLEDPGPEEVDRMTAAVRAMEG